MYDEQYDESIDVYAFGMCLLEMATGEYPYQECTKPFEIYKRVTQGIKPENFHKIDDDDDLKELIDVCIRLKKNQRPTVKELLNHSWFIENNGLKLELVREDNNNKRFACDAELRVMFRLKVADKSKHKNWPENEAVEFWFDVDKDNAEVIAKELKDSVDKINEEDLRYLTQAIKDKIFLYKLEREDFSEEESKQDPKPTNNTFSNNTANNTTTNNTLTSTTTNTNNNNNNINNNINTTSMTTTTTATNTTTNTAASTLTSNIEQITNPQINKNIHFSTAASTANLASQSAAQSLNQAQFQQQITSQIPQPQTQTQQVITQMADSSSSINNQVNSENNSNS